MKESNNIQKRLFDIETTPPEGMWNRIAEKLDAEDASLHAAPVVSISSKKTNNWMKLALAASFIGFATMTALWYFKKENKEIKTPDNTVNTGNPTKIIRDTVYIPNPNPIPGNVNTPQQKDNFAIQPEFKINNNQKNNKPESKDKPLPEIQKSLNKPEVPVLVNNNKLKEITIKDENGNPIRNIEVVKSVNNNTISGPDSKGDKAIANIISKISLASDKEEIDSIINNSNYWKNEVRRWREQLIKSGYSPSLINLLDIAELIKLIDKE